MDIDRRIYLIPDNPYKHIVIFIVFVGATKSATMGRIFKGTEDYPKFKEYITYMSELTEEEQIEIYHDFP